MRLRGISALVTGGASGLGLASATELVARGARGVLVDLPSSTGIEAARGLGESAAFVPADILDEGAFNEALDAAERMAPLRAVIHCAGRGGDRLRILDKQGEPADFDSFQDVVRINLFGTYNVLRLSAARMATNDP